MPSLTTPEVRLVSFILLSPIIAAGSRYQQLADKGTSTAAAIVVKGRWVISMSKAVLQGIHDGAS